MNDFFSRMEMQSVFFSLSIKITTNGIETLKLFIDKSNEINWQFRINLWKISVHLPL